MKNIFLIFISFFLSHASLYALKTGGNVKASLVSEVESIQPGQPFWVALRLEMKKDWHTYWKNPGESGVPTKIVWRLPRGFRADPIQWPAPRIIEVPPVVSYGYENEVWLLNRLHPPSDLRPGQTIDLVAKADWLECKIECIPGEADLSLRLPVSSLSPALNKNSIEKFSEVRSQLPLTATEWTFNAKASGNKIQLSFIPPSWFEGKLAAARFFPESHGVIEYSAPQFFHHRRGSYFLDLIKSESANPAPGSLAGVVVAEPGWRGLGSEKAVEIKIPLVPGALETKRSSLFVVLLFAFAGGLILNLMPCVLPILSIKVLGFIQQGAVDRRRAWVQSGLFTLGILVSFWILAGLLLFLRAGGQQLGWGFQLQSPVFVFLLASLFMLLGLNLFGVWEMGTSLARLGSYSSGAHGSLGSFLSGALTTIVATPCTAPFMGSALGFALTQPAFVSLLIFTALGLGVAAPYVILSSFPPLASFVPKPGEWMNSLKQFMGFVLMGTVIWLIWVLTQQKGQDVLIIVMGTLLIQSMGAWMWGRWGQPGRSKTARLIGTGGFLLLTGLSLAWGIRAIHSLESRASLSVKNGGDGIEWEPFSPELIDSYRQKGEAAFVDFTAAWCLTCKVNERVALNSPEVIKKIREKNIRMIKADWTSRDPGITKALQEFGRNGVPLYVLYGPDPATPPRLLPELLTPQIVVRSLDEIK